jgi:MFS-type transporter involved in bile tolerance (Atg22 family)
MISMILIFAYVSPFEVIPIFLMFGFWVVIFILPIVYIVYSIKQRQKILTQLEQLFQEFRSLRRSIEAIEKPKTQNKIEPSS